MPDQTPPPAPPDAKKAKPTITTAKYKLKPGKRHGITDPISNGEVLELTPDQAYAWRDKFAKVDE